MVIYRSYAWFLTTQSMFACMAFRIMWSALLQIKVAKAFTVVVVAFIAIAVLVLELVRDHKKRMDIIGSICVVFSIIMYFSPLTIMVSSITVFMNSLFQCSINLKKIKNAFYLSFLTIISSQLFSTNNNFLFQYAEIGDSNSKCEIHAILAFFVHVSQRRSMVLLCIYWRSRHLHSCTFIVLNKNSYFYTIFLHYTKLFLSKYFFLYSFLIILSKYFFLSFLCKHSFFLLT